jgi:hypothetical protein
MTDAPAARQDPGEGNLPRGRRARSRPSRLGLLGALAIAGLLGSAARAQAPDADALKRANQLISDGQLAAASEALAEAYAASHDPQLQLRLGRLYVRLDRPAEARAAFQRFLDEAQAPHPALREEAQRALRTLPAPSVQVPTAPALPPAAFATAPELIVRELEVQPIEFADRRTPRLWKAGLAIFLGGYVPSLITATAIAPFLDQIDSPSPAANYSLMVPGLGPLISAAAAPASRSGPPYGPSIVGWSLPVLITSGLVQATGLTLMIVGLTPRRTAALSGPTPRRTATLSGPNPRRTAAHVALAVQPGGLLFSGRF